jgi:hypothetical protein
MIDFRKLALAFAALGACGAAIAARVQPTPEAGEAQAGQPQDAQPEPPAQSAPAPEPEAPPQPEQQAEPAPQAETPAQPEPPTPAPQAVPPAQPEPPTPAPQAVPQTGGLEALEGTRNELEAAQPSASATPSAPSSLAVPLTRAEQGQLQRTVERGRLLAAIARAGMIATRDMLTRVPDPEGAGIVGWLAEPEGNAMTVTFYSDGEGGPRLVYRASVLGGRVTSRNVHISAPGPALTPIQGRMARARAAAAGQEHRPCAGDQFNYLVVPPAGAAAPVDVYQVTPALQAGRFPLGGHFRTTVAADGTVAETRGFTNACLEVEVPPPTPGQQPRPLGVTHLRDPMPVEIHVMAALLTGRPLLVATGEPERVWLVAGDRIAEVRPRS